jgi:hypothetical protein
MLAVMGTGQGQTQRARSSTAPEDHEEGRDVVAGAVARCRPGVACEGFASPSREERRRADDELSVESVPSRGAGTRCILGSEWLRGLASSREPVEPVGVLGPTEET